MAQHPDSFTPSNLTRQDVNSKKHTPGFHETASPNGRYRILSFNFSLSSDGRTDVSEAPSERLSEQSREDISSMLQNCLVDIACFQNLRRKDADLMHKTIARDWLTVSTLSHEESNLSIFYRKSKFEKLKEGCFRLSEQADKKNCGSARYLTFLNPELSSFSVPCIVHVTLQTALELKRSFIVLNTRFGDTAGSTEIRSAQIAVEYLREIDTPFLFCGTFECPKTSQPIQILASAGKFCREYSEMNNLPTDYILHSPQIFVMHTNLSKDKLTCHRILGCRPVNLFDFAVKSTPPDDARKNMREGSENLTDSKAEDLELVHKFIEYLKAFGMHSEGIFRIPGRKEIVDKLLNEFQQEKKLNLHEEVDVNDVCSLLKAYLREIEDPIIPKDIFQQYLASETQVSVTCKHRLLEEAFTQTSPKAKYLIRFLFDFLHSVSTMEETNKMSAKNLATVLAPTLCPSTSFDDPIEYVQLLPTIINLLELLILNPKILYYSGDP